MNNEWKEVAKYILEPLDGHNIENLKLVVTRLKQSDGEGWAVGEMLERTLNFVESTKEFNE